ncbi:hypothetical protein AHAS_Ahas20G0120200 [Arachis hypogaea]
MELCLPPFVAVWGLSLQVIIRHSQRHSPTPTPIRSHQSQARRFFLELGVRRLHLVVVICHYSSCYVIKGQ